MKQKEELAWLCRKAKPAAKGVALFTLGYCLSAGISVLYALVMKALVDSAVGQDMSGFFRGVLLYVALLAGQLTLNALVGVLDELCHEKMSRRLQADVFDTLTRMEHGSLSAYHTGTLMSHITSDVDTVVCGTLEILPDVLSLLVKLAGVAVILILWDRRFALVLLLGGAVMMAAALLMRRTMKRLQKAAREENDKTWSFLEESIQSMTILKAFRAQELIKRRLDARMERMQKVELRRALFSNLCNRGFAAAVNGGYLLGLVWCGIGLLQGTISYGTLTAVLNLVGQIQAPFSQLSGYVPKYYAMCTSAERLMALENQPAEQAVPLSGAEETALYDGLAAIRAEGLGFSYGSKKVYSGASLCIRKGETVAFMGGSGIGKSTFLKLLLALYPPEQGSVYLENRDGGKTPVSVATRGLFAYVPQENALLSGSIWECVALFKTGEELSEEEKLRVQNACRTACAEEFIRELPQGYDTVLGEGGKGLSEGQMQRLAVARALYAGSPVLLLDEATSALDETTEARLLANLQENATGKTILIVTHRRAALALCDRVFEVKQGLFLERKETT